MKRIKTHKQKCAKLLTATPQPERIKRVSEKSWTYRLGQMKHLRMIMYAIMVLLAGVLIAGSVLVINLVQNAERLEWTWLNEFMGKSPESTALSSTPSQETSRQEEEPDDFRLLVINADEPAPEGYRPETLAEIDGVAVDGRIAEDLNLLLAAAAQDGVAIALVRGFTDETEQARLHEEAVNRLLAQGYSQVIAERDAALSEPPGGLSDFQTGLTLAISTSESGAFQDSKTYQWLLSNGGTYGFVFRYPQGKEAQTGVSANLKALRYVGAEHATRMRQLQMCLEEYEAYLRAQLASE